MLLRHASAEIDGFNQEDDHEKPLDDIGKIDCINLSNWLKKSYLDFDLVITSDATRALQTSSLVFEPLNVLIKRNPSFYLCNYEEIFSVLKSFKPQSGLAFGCSSLMNRASSLELVSTK
mgnify:CR=1 FL=1